MLKLVIAARNGEDSGGLLTSNGREQSLKLAKAIESEVSGFEKIVLLSSLERSAVETAQIIGDQLCIKSGPCVELLARGRCSGEMQSEAILKMAGDCDVVIAVTHFLAPLAIMDAFSSKFFEEELKCREIKKGEAISFSLKSGKVSYLP